MSALCRVDSCGSIIVVCVVVVGASSIANPSGFELPRVVVTRTCDSIAGTSHNVLSRISFHGQSSITMAPIGSSNVYMIWRLLFGCIVCIGFFLVDIFGAKCSSCSFYNSPGPDPGNLLLRVPMIHRSCI